MKVAIVGSSGYIAGYLIENLQEKSNDIVILKIGHCELDDIYFDLNRPNEIDYNLLLDVDYVIFTAAISSPDKCALNFEYCWNVNVIGTEIFIREALLRECKVLFFSSDAVYGDISGNIYDEKSDTKAITPYGRMKKHVEDAFKENSNFKILRLSYVVSVKDKFVSYCLSCIKEGKTANVYHPFYRNCIVANDIIDVINWFLYHWKEYTPCVLNIAGKELVSRVRIADEINRYLDNQLKYSICKPDINFYNNRPAITQMKSLYLSQYHIFVENSFTDKIRKELEKI